MTFCYITNISTFIELFLNAILWNFAYLKKRLAKAHQTNLGGGWRGGDEQDMITIGMEAVGHSDDHRPQLES